MISLAKVVTAASSLATSLVVLSTLISSSHQVAAQSTLPTNISSTCTSFLTSLDSDSRIKTCTAPLLSATQYYTNTTTGSTSTEDADDALRESLGELCTSGQGCDSDMIRQYLNQFWTACTTEITAQNKAVQDVYDVLYLINPFREAICSTDGNGNYCLTEVASNSTSSKRSLPEHRLLSRQADNATDAATAVDSFSGSNIAFLFLEPTASKDVLCSTCSQNILASYIEFETSIPYAIGLANSDILSGQSELYKAGKEVCGNDWAVEINKIAGTTDFAKVAGAGMVKVSMTLALVVSGATVVTQLLL